MNQPLAGDRNPQTRGVSLARVLAVTQGDRPFVNEMEGEFAKDAVAAMKGLETAASRGDTASARKYAHSLKGLAATADAVTLTDLATRAELAAQAGDLTSLTPLSAAIAPEVEAVAQGLREIWGETA